MNNIFVHLSEVLKQILILSLSSAVAGMGTNHATRSCCHPPKHRVRQEIENTLEIKLDMSLKLRQKEGRDNKHTIYHRITFIYDTYFINFTYSSVESITSTSNAPSGPSKLVVPILATST